MERAKVKWWDDTKGYGFLTLENGCDVFVHYSKIEMRGRRFLSEGTYVEADVEKSDRGLAAVKVIPVPAEQPEV